MSEKSKVRMKKYEKKQQKQANRIIEGIFISLILIAIAFLVVFAMN